MTPVAIVPTDAHYPQRLQERLGKDAPRQLIAMGNLDLLGLPTTALFCSVRAPGHAILAAHDQAVRWRDEGRCVIGGFHSPLEKECLRILLRGKQPIIICPARAMESMRIPTDCRTAFEARRILFLSPFMGQPTRVIKESAIRRNEVVAAMADEAYIAHVSPGGQTAQIAEMLSRWRIPVEAGL